MTETPSLVLVDIDGTVACVTLNRPEALNALSRALMSELARTLVALGERDDVDVIVLTGAGRAFCVGLDLKELGGEVSPSQPLDADETNVSDAIAALRQPVIGAINGYAITGGFELALACDFLYAAESAQFADTHARVGIVPGWGLSQKLPRLVGINRAREISFTGTCQMVLSSWQTLPVTPLTEDALHDYSVCLLSRIAQCLVGRRPGRIEPRVLKRRRHGYPLMKESRQVFKARRRPPM